MIDSRVESPIEDIFVENAEKYFADDVRPEPQVSFTTALGGRFRVDFLVQDAVGKRIVFELDGREFHDYARDSRRDAILLGENHVDVIYRIPGVLIFRQTAHVFFELSRSEPRIFSQRGIINLKRLVIDRAKVCVEAEEEDIETYERPESCHSRYPIERRDRADRLMCEKYLDAARAAGLEVA